MKTGNIHYPIFAQIQYQNLSNYGKLTLAQFRFDGGFGKMFNLNGELSHEQN